ncbi:MAG TPA: DUF4124 domain-containing protein [Steroidobacteraceae bacterium]|nr:DUF4124 domain-containing protein [Steroidobacteraceae bacterium]
MRALAFTLMWLGCTLAIAGATVYKWTDEDGVVHYSDQPHANAEKVHVNSAQTFKEAGMSNSGGYEPPASYPGTKPTATTADHTYQGCAVVQPADDQSFANLDALNIVVQTDPVIKPGDRIFVSLDGQPVNNGAPTGGQFTLTPVDRGTHTLQAQVRSADGTVVCQTPSITFHVHQASIRNPVNPVRPH